MAQHAGEEDPDGEADQQVDEPDQMLVLWPINARTPLGRPSGEPLGEVVIVSVKPCRTTMNLVEREAGQQGVEGV